MKVLFLTLYPENMASSRYRVYQFLPYLKSKGISFDVYSAVPDRMFKSFYNTSSFLGNLSYLSTEIVNRIYQLLKSRFYDIVFIQKSLTTINLRHLPVILKKNKIIFDIDDNIFEYPVSIFSNRYLKTFQNDNQSFQLARISERIIVGNNYLKNKVAPYNNNIFVIPTCIDADRFVPANEKSNNKKVIIGWMGSPSTSKYLQNIAGVFKALQEKYDIELRVVGDIKVRLSEINLSSVKWEFKKEVEELQNFGIGIMPMPDNKWTRGKCGLKILQYMAVEVPVVCSPVGVNNEIIQDGVNGFLANSKEEWIEKLSLLIENSDLRRKIGLAGRKTVEEKYSLEINAPKFLEVLTDVDKR